MTQGHQTIGNSSSILPTKSLAGKTSRAVRIAHFLITSRTFLSYLGGRICGVDIVPSQDSRTFEVSSLRASVGELTEKNSIAPSEAEIYEYKASKNSRPSKKELIPSMLRVLGFVERDGKWFLSSAKDAEAPAQKAEA